MRVTTAIDPAACPQGRQRTGPSFAPEGVIVSVRLRRGRAACSACGQPYSGIRDRQHRRCLRLDSPAATPSSSTSPGACAGATAASGSRRSPGRRQTRDSRTSWPSSASKWPRRRSPPCCRSERSRSTCGYENAVRARPGAELAFDAFVQLARRTATRSAGRSREPGKSKTKGGRAGLTACAGAAATPWSQRPCGRSPGAVRHAAAAARADMLTSDPSPTRVSQRLPTCSYGKSTGAWMNGSPTCRMPIYASM